MRWGIVLGFLFTPVLAFAATTNFFGPIVPACTEAEGSIRVCQACNLVQLADNLLRVFVALGVMATVLMFAYAGFLYVTAASNKSNIDSAKKIFTNSLIGLIIILCAYLIVDVVIRLSTNQSLNVFTKVDCLKMTHTRGGFTYSRTQPAESPVTAEQGGQDGTPVTGGDPVCQNGENLSTAVQKVNGTTSYIPGGGGIQGKDVDSFGNTPYTIQDCKNDGASCSTCKPITVAVPQDMMLGCKLKGGNTVTWPEVAAAYGLPACTQFQLSDSYGCYWKDPNNHALGDSGRRYDGVNPCQIGHGPNGLTFDIAACHGGQKCNSKINNQHPTQPPVLVPGN